MTIKLLNIDCMDYMKGLEDNSFDLAIVDPPYGINFGQFNRTNKQKNGKRYKADKYKNSDWDSSIPDEKYFSEIRRVSRNQIIWGGNYFLDYLGSMRCFIFWYKKNPAPNFSDGEIAWTSFDKVAKCFELQCFGNVGGDKKRIHPTQKPVKLYDWLLSNYANEGDRILDTHLGSGSSAIAAHYGGFDFVGMELDKDYYDAACKRFEQETAQQAIEF